LSPFHFPGRFFSFWKPRPPLSPNLFSELPLYPLGIVPFPPLYWKGPDLPPLPARTPPLLGQGFSYVVFFFISPPPCVFLREFIFFFFFFYFYPAFLPLLFISSSPCCRRPGPPPPKPPLPSCESNLPFYWFPASSLFSRQP